ncbi:MAG: hypothetical protein OEV92_08680 [Nitrospinota bacterium]|nr:hypothetical protein [Nitrospinota bacterium]
MAGRIRSIRENGVMERAPGVLGSLQGLERELMEMARAISIRELGANEALFCVEGATEPGGVSLASRERSIRARNLVRFILRSYAMQIQAGQRASSYSRQDCLDDMESILETLLEWLSAGLEGG